MVDAIHTNLFDAMVDSIYAALEKAGAPNVRVVVWETGWPSAGGFVATVDNARRYNQAAIDHVRRARPRGLGAGDVHNICR
ncbi:Glucan endo-1,3-beta-glucosidase GIV [Panicum miliaceum]|uniref:Glucan endo-1,3-beta-glucosidase GIV n=1 Tax=Panicum miliaceum TaxID=4540 RepID=A0A3L6PR03_PANMI|nr:Glucan endo-1,3-beta-glucosidase GIV [Panicum miliaceum]